MMIEQESERREERTKARRSALQIGLIEFVIVFASALCWNLVRKTGESVLDSFGVAVITAVFLYIVERQRNS
jgi:hypothetical protein